ncbi:DUF5777 family beta-barrel protein [Mucilaginibacter ginsenosidivorans]|uniref:DUF5777 domain-containing protein n=1 Tax=Mucilaginibacter ginsenosidivorans TaxID=398053 RepID=A0A5B8UY86_9SPHI|nr:DUF5777 family beta-barrel protein [Mucilaginibacter ginsenosidivorans]QEC63301.1 hypothetical protein FRZ54_12175 [Mucilaginibacter ginsenosidivorans]
MKKSIILIALLALCIGVKAQKTDTAKKEPSADSLMNSLSAGDDKHAYILSAFKATRLIFSPTTEMVRKKNLNFLVIHRFGDIATGPGGARTLFGLDAVNDVYIGFEYGVSDNFNINFGRSTIGQLVELQLKYALLHQTNDNSSPLGIALMGGTGVRPYGNFASFSDRLSYIAQAVFSRKFTQALSLEVSPVFVSDNQPIPNEAGNENSFFSLTAAGRLKVTKHMSILVDWEHPFSSYRTGTNGFQDPLGFGAEFETGGHVFTLNFTNARAVSQINSLSNSQASWGRGEYRFGFTISRMFDFNRKKEKKW